jgi:type IV secretory pathway TrbL component
MKEAVFRKIELNEHYHQSKETMAWVASSLYLGFSVAVIKWLFEKPLCVSQNIFSTIILSVVYLAALAFITFQFRHRWQSVYESYALNDLLKECTDEAPVSAFPELYEKAVEVHKNKKCNKRNAFLIMVLTIFFPIVAILFLLYRVSGRKKDIIDSRYHTEIPTYGLITYFFVSQVILLYWA